jgi:flagellar biosynthesis anti-sigma factor FlgM
MANIERTGLGNGIQVSTPATRGVERTGQSEGGRKSNALGGGREDEVQLSGLASQIAALQPDSSARLERVNALQQAVASGKYTVDAQVLSQDIIREAGGE